MLRRMGCNYVPFTNDQGLNDMRSTKVQQKVFGCFLSEKGTVVSSRNRSYIATRGTHRVTASASLRLLFSDEVPVFMCDT